MDIITLEVPCELLLSNQELGEFREGGLVGDVEAGGLGRVVWGRMRAEM